MNQTKENLKTKMIHLFETIFNQKGILKRIRNIFMFVNILYTRNKDNNLFFQF